MNSFRRNEYGSSPPTRGDSSSYSSRGIHGRWESRSSGRSDKESDSQSDWDSGKALDKSLCCYWYNSSMQTYFFSGVLFIFYFVLLYLRLKLRLQFFFFLCGIIRVFPEELLLAVNI